MHIRDGGDLHIPGYAFAPVFSIWTTIEECLNPPVVWSDGDWHTTEPFSAPEGFLFPEGIGPVECVNVEHEEVLLVPRWIPGVKRVTFKYALGADFIEKLKFLHDIGLDRTEPVTVRGVDVSPRDVVAAVVPDPITMGDKMVGRAVVGTWVIGRKDGQAARGLPVPDGRRAPDDAHHPLAGRRLADRLQPGAGHGAAGHRRVVRLRGAWSGGLRGRSVPGADGSTTASITAWSRWSPGPIGPPEDGPFDHRLASA